MARKETYESAKIRATFDGIGYDAKPAAEQGVNVSNALVARVKARLNGSGKTAKPSSELISTG